MMIFMMIRRLMIRIISFVVGRRMLLLFVALRRIMRASRNSKQKDFCLCDVAIFPIHNKPRYFNLPHHAVPMRDQCHIMLLARRLTQKPSSDGLFTATLRCFKMSGYIAH